MTCVKLLFVPIHRLLVYLYMGLVIGEPYRSDVSPEYAIRGNSVLFKCSIPPFVADFVSVTSWIDDVGNDYYNINENGVSNYGTNNFI